MLETQTETLGPGFTSYKINDLLYGRTYIFTIKPLYGEVEGPITTVYQRICKTSLSSLKCSPHSFTKMIFFNIATLILLFFFNQLFYAYALCTSVGPDPSGATLPSVPATAAPSITSASRTASIAKTTTAHAATRTTRHPIAVPPIQTLTTKKAPARPSVTETKATTASPDTTAVPRPGIFHR